jgi:acyl-CoA thioesterase II
MSGHEVTPARDIGAVLMLEEAGLDVWRSVTPDTNVGGEVFGGQYLGLSVAAAMRSAPDRLPHAMTSYFLRGARADRPVDYQVERTRDGRAFAHRRVTAVQDGKEVFRAEISFHEWEPEQPSHHATPPPVPPLEAMPSLHKTVLDQARELDPVTIRRIIAREHFSIHLRDPEEGLGRAGERPEIMAWVRPNPPPPAGDAVAYYATLAYMTDSCANFAARTMHADSLYDGQLMSVSLNHGIWFHTPPAPLERVLYALDSPFAGGGLGYSRGTIFDTQGQVIASVVQDALIRRQPVSHQPRKCISDIR